MTLVNWAGNITFGAARLHRPSTIDQLREVVAGSRRVRALGTAHSFNRIADTDGDLVSVAGLPPAMDIDTAGATVRVAGGVRYGELAAYLHRNGHALPNLASLPHISVAGACATGTHGSGQGNGNLPSSVSALEFVAADGTLAELSRGADGFSGAVVGLGALGIVTTLTLDLVPTFDLRQDVYENLPRAQVAGHADEILAAGYSVSLFTDWTGPTINQVWVKRRVDGTAMTAEPRWLGATLADGPRHPVPGASPVHCTQQQGVPGPWHTRLPHFRAEFTPSSGDELQSEFLLPRQAAIDALAALDPIADQIAPVLHISEIRTVAADELWLSPSYRRDSVAIHFTWHSDFAAVRPVLARVEERLAPFAARPHWGKIFATPPDVVRGLYPAFRDFVALARAYDPDGAFRNAMLDRYLAAPSAIGDLG